MEPIFALLAKTAIGRAIKRFGPSQVCFLCLAATTALGWWATSSFARETDLSDVVRTVGELRADSIAKQIYDFQVRVCSSEDRRWLNEQLGEKQRQYKALTGERFELPPCGQL